MQMDIRGTDLYREAESLYKKLRRPGSGLLSTAADVHVDSTGRHAAFSGCLIDRLEGAPPTRICQINLKSADLRVLTFGPGTDRLPKYSPDGRTIAFLSDRHKAGDFQLHLLDPIGGGARCASVVNGWVEFLQWSPDGERILLGVTGRGADVSGAQGAISSKRDSEDLPSWMPAIETGDERYRWRHVWVYELATDQVRQVSRAGTNIWEAVWCGNDTLAAVVSTDPGEGAWYGARFALVDLQSGDCREIYTPQDQLGGPAASPSGKLLAVVEAVCSDRGVVAGDLRIIEAATSEVRRVDTWGVDITYAEWRSEVQLLFAGHRGLDTVVALYDAIAGTFTEVWSSREITTGRTLHHGFGIRNFRKLRVGG